MTRRKPSPPPPWSLDLENATLTTADGGTLIDLCSIRSPLDMVRCLEELLEVEAPEPLVALGALLAVYPVSELARPCRLTRAAQRALITRAATKGPPPRLARADRELQHVVRLEESCP